MKLSKLFICIIVVISNVPLFADIGDIAVINASKETATFRNRFDLIGKKITFIPNSAGGYNVTTSTGRLSGMQGDIISPYPDPPKKITFKNGFTFTFYGVKYNSIFVWAWGNVAFGEKGKSCGCAPTINPFQGSFPDEVRILETSERLTVTWKRIDPNSPTRPDSQLNLFKNGKFEFLYGGDYRQGGDTRVSPGQETKPEVREINFSRGNYSGGAKTEFVEYFLEEPEIKITPVVQEFHQKHAQVFDFVVIFSDEVYPYQGMQFLAAQNSIKGIGLPKFDRSASFGSSQLQGVIFMNSLKGYPIDPVAPVNGPYNTLQSLAHFLGKRWIPYARVKMNGAKTKDLQGYTCPFYFDGDFECKYKYYPGIWNFYMDTDASVMGGNDIRENGNNSFTTVGSAIRYSLLDQYLMGLRSPDTVPPFFFVTGTPPPDDIFGIPVTALLPEPNITFTGTKVNVNIRQIIEAEGPRIPASAQSQKEFRVAFVYFINPGKKPGSAEIARIDRIRKMFESFFQQTTDQKGKINTRLH